ncbi:MAG: hypothetical protein SFV54_06150 [Bryobacteraceae bacterium]|nr:hypothetical protein [Bryobacteraceae bacterium]
MPPLFRYGFSYSVVLPLALAALAPAQTVPAELWRRPPAVESLDLYHGPGGPRLIPRPPFRLIEKNTSGTAEKYVVRDAAGRVWEAKLGPEVQAEVFATRLVWALGYYADPTYFVPAGRIGDRPFTNARFELRDPARKFRPDLAWNWNQNPFTGRRDFNGLRILVMLLSGWDNKDRRNTESNTGVVETIRNGRPVWTYYVTDWGSTMGRWGGFFTREKWSCEDYAEQSPRLVKGVKGSDIDWGFTGKRRDDIAEGITVDDVRWLMQYLGRISDSQIRAALRAAAAGPHQTECFTRSLRTRIQALRRLASSPAPPRRTT